MSLVQDGTGNDDFAGVTCLPALQIQLALAALLLQDPVLLLCTYCSPAPALPAISLLILTQNCCWQFCYGVILATRHTSLLSLRSIMRTNFCMV